MKSHSGSESSDFRATMHGFRASVAVPRGVWGAARTATELRRSWTVAGAGVSV